MIDLRKKLKTLGLVAGAVGTLSFSKTDKVSTNRVEHVNTSSIIQKVNDIRFLINENITQENREHLLQLIGWAEEIPIGRQILQALYENGTKITVSNNMSDEKIAGTADMDLSVVTLSEKCWDNPLLSFATFIHEGEHVRTIANDHANGITLNSFKTQEDQYTWAFVRESLPVRKEILAMYELLKLHPELDTDHKWSNLLNNQAKGDVSVLAQMFFDKRMSGEMLDWEGQYIYESSVHGMAKIENIPNVKKLPVNPDWNKLVSMSSGGEVQKINVLPIPSMSMVGSIIERGLIDQGALYEKKGDIKQIDLTCVLKNKDAILDQGDFCHFLCDKVAQNAFWLIKNCVKNPEQLKPWLSELKTIMPEEQIKLLEESDESWYVLPLNFFTDKVENFLSEQKPFEYLKKVQKIMSSSKLEEGYRNNIKIIENEKYGPQRMDPSARLFLGRSVFNALDQIFFEKENQQLMVGKDWGKIHL